MAGSGFCQIEAPQLRFSLGKSSCAGQQNTTTSFFKRLDGAKSNRADFLDGNTLSILFYCIFLFAGFLLPNLFSSWLPACIPLRCLLAFFLLILLACFFTTYFILTIYPIFILSFSLLIVFLSQSIVCLPVYLSPPSLDFFQLWKTKRETIKLPRWRESSILESG